METEYNPVIYKYQVIRQFNPHMGDFYWTIEIVEIDDDEIEMCKKDIQNGIYLLPYQNAVEKYGDEDDIYITTDVLGTFVFEKDAERFIHENVNLYEFQNRHRDKFIKEYKTPYEFI